MKKTQPTNTTDKKQKQRLAFPTYDEEDILDWDAAIVTPPPRRFGTIQVRLIYKGRRKPFPAENFGKRNRYLDLIEKYGNIDLKQRIAHGENTTTEFKENFDQEVMRPLLRLPIPMAVLSLLAYLIAEKLEELPLAKRH